MSETALSRFRYSEARFAEVTGLSRGDAKYLRDQKLLEDEHWQRRYGEIALTLPGIKKLWRCLEKKPLLLELSSIEILNGAGKTPIPLGAPREVKITAVPANPHILLGVDDYGQPYTLRRPRGSFHVGLEVDVQPDATPGLWRIVSAVPRFAGDRGYKPLGVPEKK